MELMNCRNCKKLFNYITGEKLCPACKALMEDKFQEVKRYIEEYQELGAGRTSVVHGGFSGRIGVRALRQDDPQWKIL